MKKYIKNNWVLLFLTAIFSSLTAIFAVSVQFLKGDVLDYALSNNFDKTIRYGCYLGIFIIAELGFYYLYDMSRGKFAVDSMKKLRADYFDSLISKDYPKFLTKKQGEYIAQYTNEMEIIENQYFGTIPMLAEIIIKIVIVSISLFILEYRIAIITLVLLTLPLYIPKLIEKKLQRAQVEFVDQFEKHIKEITDWLRGFEMIKNFSIERIISEKFRVSNNITMEKNLRKRQINYLTKSISATLSYFSHFIILVFAAYLVLKGDFTAGQFFIAVGMIDQLSYPIISLSYFIQDLISVKPVNKSILKFIDERTVKYADVEIDKEDFQEVIFDDVSFGYENQEHILKNINMRFMKNNQYLLRGASGSGKTTSMNLLLDYYRPSSGCVKINDIPVNEIKNLNDIITVMRQDAILFEDTLRNNLTMYQDISDEKLIAALFKVGLENYANSEKLDMLIQENGVNLSGGEKRRITLARSMLRETPILILDEPLANLDEKNAKSIEQQLISIKDRTLIIISHQFTEMNSFYEVYVFN
ncbi:ABC transporter ATP-binding protein [Soehngenia longivitae]|uniref:ABC transporter ATP-binding protein n=1 Tax=Soehngenia longivitae TaxID=2562294 RepID=A0A4Z0D423_9FIRM|nr:ABC transporter ATP-binding protein [Soehngenia longivitae]TFZ40198.1 ABC transporter ATP-binding protein [Soehngenia longivitae]